MGAGKGRSRRARSATIAARPGASINLRPEAASLLEKAIQATPKASNAEKTELQRWAQAYSDKGDLNYSAALTLWTLSGIAEKKGRKINKRTPEKERQILLQRAQSPRGHWKNYDDIRMGAEFEAMRYLAENFPETKVALNEIQTADYEEAVELLCEKTGLDTFKVWETHYIPKQSDDPVLNFLQESYGDEFP